MLEKVKVTTCLTLVAAAVMLVTIDKKWKESERAREFVV